MKNKSSSVKYYTDYESRLGLSRGSLLKTIAYGRADGAWQQLERGEISLPDFGKLISNEYFAKVQLHIFTSNTGWWRPQFACRHSPSI